MASANKTICVDFDGVISEYKSWLGKGVFGPPLPGAAEYLKKLESEGWTIIVYTTRSETEYLVKYLKENDIPYHHVNFNPENIEQGCNIGKPLATVYLDDRGITFDGDWGKAYEAINNFEVWYRKK